MQISDNGLDNELKGFESKRILTHIEQRRCKNGLGKDGDGVPQAFLLVFGEELGAPPDALFTP